MENQRKSGENEMQLKTGCEQQDAGPMEQYPQDTVHFATHCQFRNAKANFAMPKPISQCQIQFRNAKFKFAMPISISQCQYTVHLSQPMRNFALRNSQPTLRISQTHFALRNSLPLRNSHLQALSSPVINATDFQTW